MSNDQRVAISGRSGCGNTTVSRLVADALGVPLINYTFKDLARDRGMSFEEVCLRAEDDPEFDLYIDRRQLELAQAGGCVLGSRLAIWLLSDSAFTVYLDASPEVRSGRIARREEISYELALRRTVERDRRDQERYLRLYGFDVNHWAFAKLVIDTEPLRPQAIADRILAAVPASRGTPA